MIVLETERLLLRDPEVQDLEGFCAMEADFEVRRFVGGYPRTRQEAAARFRRGLRAKKSDLPFCTMIYKPERCSIGRCGLHPVPGGDVALGFYIARAYWGQGLATEAGRAFVKLGFLQLQLPKIVSTVERGNTASVRVLEKLGFQWVSFEPGELRSFDHFELCKPASTT